MHIIHCINHVRMWICRCMSWICFFLFIYFCWVLFLFKWIRSIFVATKLWYTNCHFCFPFKNCKWVFFCPNSKFNTIRFHLEWLMNYFIINITNLDLFIRWSWLKAISGQIRSFNLNWISILASPNPLYKYIKN